MGDDEWVDVLANGAVLKQTVRASPLESTENSTPEFKQEVLVHVVGRLKSDPGKIFHDTRRDGKPVRTFVGDNILDMLPPGVMLVVRSMAVGEITRVKLASRFAFGQGASWMGVGPDEDVEYEVELLQVGEPHKEVPEMTFEELEERCGTFKSRGNEFFKYNELDKALRCYKEGVRYGDGALQMQQESSKPVGVEDKYFQDRLACLNNIATCLERQGKLKEAMESTVLVLEIQPRHLKSLVRAARIAIQQGSHEEAVAAVEAAVIVAPDNASVHELKRDLQVRIATHKQKEKERYGGFLKPVSKEERERLAKQAAQVSAVAEANQTFEDEASSKGTAKNVTEPNPSSKSIGNNAIEESFDLHEEMLESQDSDTSFQSEQSEISKLPESPVYKYLSKEYFELLARLLVLLSPALIALFSVFIWSLLAV